jgi:hypothetical protein
MIVKQALLVLTVVMAALAAGVPASSGGTSAKLSPSASCKAGAVPAIVNATFTCLKAAGPCQAKFQQAYAKYKFSCASGRLIRVGPAPPPVPGTVLADAFLNSKPRDVTTRATTFKVAGPPPVLHLTFAQALKGQHTLSVDVHNTTVNTGQTFETTLQNGWLYVYEALPAIVSNSAAGSYRVTISIDGRGKKQLSYSVTS